MAGDRKLLALLFSVSLNPLLSGSSNVFGKFSKIRKFGILQPLLRDWLQISRWVVRKDVLHTVCFAYLLLSLLLSLLVLLAVLVFPLLPF